MNTEPRADAARGCGSPAGGIRLTGGAGSEAVVLGRVRRAGRQGGRGGQEEAGSAVTTGYARLLGSGGEFVAEVPLGADGEFTFYAAPGSWTVRVLAPGGVRLDRVVRAEAGAIAEVEVVV
jgi:Protein of unknown function (DUF1416)